MADFINVLASVATTDDVAAALEAAQSAQASADAALAKPTQERRTVNVSGTSTYDQPITNDVTILSLSSGSDEDFLFLRTLTWPDDQGKIVHLVLSGTFSLKVQAWEPGDPMGAPAQRTFNNNSGNCVVLAPGESCDLQLISNTSFRALGGTITTEA